MAKMFYTMDEAKVALGRTEDEIRQLTKEGKLREFRDGPRLMFKADQVDSLKGSLPSSKDTIDIADSGAPLSLVDSKSGTGTGSGVSIKDDTSAGDLGLAGSFGSKVGLGSSRAGSASGTGTGMNIFSTDETDADPSAATAITPASESANLEAVGSGSGLLDLTRESDDTSLGAVLDEIPNKRDSGSSRTGSGAAIAAATGGGGGISAASAGQMGRAAPVLITRPDPTSPFFGGLALGGAVLCLFSLFVLAAAVTGAQVALVDQMVKMGGLLVILGICAGVVILCGAIGFGLGKVVK